MSNNDEFVTFYAVWTKPVKGTGSFRPMRRTFDTLEKAQEASIQMTRKNPNTKFFVMQAIERHIMESDTSDESETSSS